jgi:hypothetical protein
MSLSFLPTFRAFGGGKRTIAAPSGFTWRGPSITIFKDSETGKYSSSITANTYNVARTNHFYADTVNGNDGWDGTSATFVSGSTGPKKTYTALITLFATAWGTTYKNVHVHLAPGVYAGSATSIACTEGFTLTCDTGIATLIPATAMGGASMTLESGTTYKATGVVATFGWDSRITDQYGSPTLLNSVGDLATCRATPGSRFADATDTYVNLADGRVPDNDVFVFTNATTINFACRKGAFLKNIRSYGGNPMSITSPLGATEKYGFLNCHFATYVTGINAGSINVDTGFFVFENCSYRLSYDADGLNVHMAAAYSDTSVLEINCIGNSNGLVGGVASNGTTVHDGVGTIRLNGEYRNNKNRNVHDIGAGHQWLLGCVTGVGENGFTAGNAADASKMWLDSCRISETHSQYDINVFGAGAAIYVKGMSLFGSYINITGGSTFIEYDCAPAVGNVVVDPFLTTAKVYWRTLSPADSQVEYGLTTAYGDSTALDASLVTSHEVAISGLTTGATYHYRVRTANAGGLVSYSGDSTFVPASTPDDISSLVVWVKADRDLYKDSTALIKATLDGDPVGAWFDIKSKYHPIMATNAKRPILKLNQYNGRPCLRFDGSDDYLQSANFGVGVLAQPNTIFVVYKFLATGATKYIIDGNDGVNRTIIYSAATSKISIYGGTLLQSALTVDTNFHLTRGLFNGASSEIQVDAAAAVVAAGGALGIDGLAVGAPNGGASPSNIDICEIILYNKALSAGEITTISGYLNTKWAIY